jgi:hypothetical protein
MRSIFFIFILEQGYWIFFCSFTPGRTSCQPGSGAEIGKPQQAALFLPLFLQIVVIAGFLLLHARLRARLRRGKPGFARKLRQGTPAEYRAVEPQFSMWSFRIFESGWQWFVKGARRAYQAGGTGNAGAPRQRRGAVQRCGVTARLRLAREGGSAEAAEAQ